MAKPKYVVCVKNQGYPASLEVRKIYAVVDDHETVKRGLIRIIDESGEDYLFPKEFFVPIELTDAIERALATAS